MLFSAESMPNSQLAFVALCFSTNLAMTLSDPTRETYAQRCRFNKLNYKCNDFKLNTQQLKICFKYFLIEIHRKKIHRLFAETLKLYLKRDGARLKFFHNKHGRDRYSYMFFFYPDTTSCLSHR
jgi:hypothetical protein